MTKDAIIERGARVEKCIEACRDCHTTCVETTAHCLHMGGEHAEAGHIILMQDCAQACQMSEEYMLRGSSYMNRACGLCAEICDACAESCERFDDEAMKRCGDRCHKCGMACREMLTGGEVRNRLTSFS